MAAPRRPPTSEPARADAPAATARVWGLLGNRRGDNAMIEAVLAASGLPARAIALRFNKLGALQNTLPRGSLFSLRAASRAALAPPWPDVVVTSGKRAVPAALRVRAASGGRTKLVHIGRPQAPLGWFDLVVTTPQYGLPERDNVFVCQLPCTQLDVDGGAATVEFAGLPHPRIAVFVGGSAAPQILDADAARALVEAALAKAKACGGSLMVATSPRTGSEATEAIRTALAGAETPVRLSVFGEGPNLFRTFLAAADAFVVTDDSVSMAIEAAATTRPVELFRLPRRPGPLLRAYQRVESIARASGAGRALLEGLVGRGLVTANRDIAGYMDGLERDGLLAGGGEVRRIAEQELAEVGRRVAMLANARAA